MAFISFGYVELVEDCVFSWLKEFEKGLGGGGRSRDRMRTSGQKIQFQKR